MRQPGALADGDTPGKLQGDMEKAEAGPYALTFLEMAEELAECKPEVCLVPSAVPECAADGGMVRVAYNRNPLWYRDLCAAFPRPGCKKKKSRTIIKRANVMELLESLAAGRAIKSKYAPYLFAEAERRLGTFEGWNDQF